MTTLEARLEARERLAALCPQWTHDPVHNAVVTVKCTDLALILAGPPVSREDVARVIGDHFAVLVSRNPQPDMSGDPRAKLQPHIRRRFDNCEAEAAQAVLLLFEGGE